MHAMEHEQHKERGSLSESVQQFSRSLMNIIIKPNEESTENFSQSMSKIDFNKEVTQKKEYNIKDQLPIIENLVKRCKEQNENKEEKKARRAKRRELKEEAKRLLAEGKLQLKQYEGSNFEPIEKITFICEEVADTYALAAQCYFVTIDLYAKQKGKETIVKELTTIKKELETLESARGRFTPREKIAPLCGVFSFWRLYRPLMIKYPECTQDSNQIIERKLLGESPQSASFGTKFSKAKKQPLEKKSSSLFK